MERWFEVPSPKKASTSYRYRHIDTDVRLYIFVSFDVRYREGRHTDGVASHNTHSWRCPAEGAGWPQGSSPHRCCPHSYSAGCRSVSPDANNSHWCSGTCTLHSQGKGGRGDKYKEKRHIFKPNNFKCLILWKELCSQSEHQAWRKYYIWCSTLQLQRTKCFVYSRSASFSSF